MKPTSVSIKLLADILVRLVVNPSHNSAHRTKNKASCSVYQHQNRSAIRTRLVEISLGSTFFLKMSFCEIAMQTKALNLKLFNSLHMKIIVTKIYTKS